MENLKNLLQSTLATNRYNILVANGLLPKLSEITSFLNPYYEKINWAQRIWHVVNNHLDIVLCEICSKNPAIFGEIEIREDGKRVKSVMGYRPCSKNCSGELRNIKSKLLGQATTAKEKRKTTILKKYGVDDHMKLDSMKQKVSAIQKKLWQQNGDEVLSKMENTNLKKFGVKNPMQNNEIKERSKNRFIQKYGVDHNFKIDHVREKIKGTLISKYGVENFSKTQTFKNFNKNKLQKIFIHSSLGDEYTLIEEKGDIIKLMHIKEGHDFEIKRTHFHARRAMNLLPCIICNPKEKHDSHAQNEIQLFIASVYTGKIIKQEKLGKHSEIDIYLPDLKLGFEYNSFYYHSTAFKDKYDHIKKKKLAEDEMGARIIFIWEDEWRDKREIVQSMIKSAIGISTTKLNARDMIIKEVPTFQCMDFLNKNHIQGATGSTIKLGLYNQDNELCSMMCFTYKKQANGAHWEIERFVSSINTNVRGASNKLLAYFIEQNIPKTIISFVDLDHFDGRMYKHNGFTLDHITSPSYYYVIKGFRYHRRGFQKKKLLEKFGIDSQESELSIMEQMGALRIYNCGNAKYTWKQV